MSRKFQWLVIKLLLLTVRVQLVRSGLDDIDINKRSLIKEANAYVEECESAMKSGL